MRDTIWRLDESLINLFQRLVDFVGASPVRWAQFCCYLGGGCSAWMVVWWILERGIFTKILYFAFMTMLYATGIPFIERLSHFGGSANPLRMSIYSKIARVVLMGVFVWSAGPFIHNFWVAFRWDQLMEFASVYLVGPFAAYFVVCSPPPPRWRHVRTPASR